MVGAMLNYRLHCQQLAFLFAEVLLDGGPTQSLLGVGMGIFEDDHHVGFVIVGELHIDGAYPAPDDNVRKSSTLSVDNLYLHTVFRHSKLGLFGL